MCGIIGVYGHPEAARLVFLGLYALQHRGEESAGIISHDGRRLHYEKAMGLLADSFDEKRIKTLRGRLAVGHVRYSTTGSSSAKNIQPFFVDHRKGVISVAHNGNLVNCRFLKDGLEEEGALFQTSMDSEVIVHLIARSKASRPEESVKEALASLEGAYSLILNYDDDLIAARDPGGFRPLCMGRFDGAYVVASETCALDLIQAKYVRDVMPGEIIWINKKGIRSIQSGPPRRHSFCIFEYIYFARPDSGIFGKSVYLSRKNLGIQLAREHPVKNADLIMPVPDSGNTAALGFAEESGIPFETGFIRNHYIGRTFIQPTQFIRDFKVKVKLNPIRDVLKGKRIVVIEDSIVRGTTSRSRVRALRASGAKEIHMRISCPPLRHPCYYGIDFPTRKELIAANKTVDRIRDFIGVDSLKYLSLEGMLKAMLLPGKEFCTACFTGDYPVKPCQRMSKLALENGRRRDQCA